MSYVASHQAHELEYLVALPRPVIHRDLQPEFVRGLSPVPGGEDGAGLKLGLSVFCIRDSVIAGEVVE